MEFIVLRLPNQNFQKAEMGILNKRSGPELIWFSFFKVLFSSNTSSMEHPLGRMCIDTISKYRLSINMDIDTYKNVSAIPWYRYFAWYRPTVRGLFWKLVSNTIEKFMAIFLIRRVRKSSWSFVQDFLILER